MSTTVKHAITAVYVGMYNRAADLNGYNWWLNNFGGNPDASVSAAQMQELAAGFASNPYFTSAYPASMSDSDFVNQLYLNIGGNPSDSAGLAYWVGQLQASDGNRVGIVAEFLYGFVSIDLSSKPAGLSELEYLQAKQRQDSLLNKISVSESFRDILGSHSNPAATDPSRLDQDEAFQLSRSIIATVDHQAGSVASAIADIQAIAASKASTSPVHDDTLSDAPAAALGWDLAPKLTIDTNIEGVVGGRISASETDSSDIYTLTAPTTGTMVFDFSTESTNEAVFRVYASNGSIFSNQLVEYPGRETYVDATGQFHVTGSAQVFEGESIRIAVFDMLKNNIAHNYSVDFWMI